MPGDFLLTARTMVSLTGTNSSWDQLYYVDSITRTIRYDGGFTMTVKCKQHPPITAVPTT